MDARANAELQRKMERDTVKVRRANNGYVINSSEGMGIASTLEEVFAYLQKKFGSTVNIKN